MLIENPDAFKIWLTSVLEPLCDADPEALAKYVFALVRKDKPTDSLRQGMLDQLDVFLQAETKPFVDLLFKTLDTQDYLTPQIPNTNPPNPNVVSALLNQKKENLVQPKTPTITDAVLVKNVKPIIPVSTLPNLTETINGTKEVLKRKSDTEKEDTLTRSGGGRSGRRNRSRSRSRSWDRSGKRSRSRDRSPRVAHRDRSRPWRNKSPPRRYDRDRRRSRSGSPAANRGRSRSRSPRHTYRSSGRYRNRSPPRSVSKSRSRSNERGGRDKKDVKPAAEKDENSGGATPTQDSNHGDTDMRLNNTIQSIQSVVSALNPPALVDGPFVTSNITAKRRCRDFDEKGFCMRGEMCPYDHGIDPVVLEDTALSHVLTFGPNGAPVVAGDGNSTGTGGGGGGGPPGLMHPMMVTPGVHHVHHRVAPAEYNPSAPGMWHHRPSFRGGLRGGPPPMGVALRAPPPGSVGPFGPMPSMQRELISVPVTDDGGIQPLVGFKRGRGGGGEFSSSPDQQQLQQQGPSAKRKAGFDFTRLGPRSGPTKNTVNCSLELKKIPRGLNNITHLNNHFAKFGKIVNIQVCYEGDPEGAIITFSSHAEANAAYRSTEAVLNNRFIKVFWHAATAAAAAAAGAGGGENIPPTSQQQHGNKTIKDRLGQPVNNKVLNMLQPKADTVQSGSDENNHHKNNNNNSVYVPSVVKKDEECGATAIAILQQQKEDSKALANAAIVKNQEILAAKEQLKKKHEEKRKEALKLKQNLRKRKQELLEKQLAQQKLLIEKLEKTNPVGQQRELLMSTIKAVQESIESIRKDMLSSTVSGNVAGGGAVVTTTSSIGVIKSKEEAQREVLDAELDLITRQQEGGDTSELQKRLVELRAQVYSLSRSGGVGGGAGGAGVGGGAGSGGCLTVSTRRGRVLRGGRHMLLMHRHSLLTKNNLLSSSVEKKNNNNRLGKMMHTIDHRPTRLLVSGYEADESESVLAHFSQYGEIIEYVTDPSTPSIALNYRSRKEAEMALLKGKHFQDRTLSITWCTDVQLTNTQRAPNTRTVILSTQNVVTPIITTTTSNGNLIETEQQSETPLKIINLDSSVETKMKTTTTNEMKQTDFIEDDLMHNEDQLLEGDDENISGEQLGAELSEEVLLQDDEEDDDENEDRSWRR